MKKPFRLSDPNGNPFEIQTTQIIDADEVLVSPKITDLVQRFVAGAEVSTELSPMSDPFTLNHKLLGFSNPLAFFDMSTQELRHFLNRI